jgi:hypothetical protein
MNIMQIFTILMVAVSLETLLLIFILWKTPAMTFLSASLFKKSLLYIIGKDSMAHFKTFKPENGAAKLGREGLFHLTENSHTLDRSSKIPIYFAFRDLAATLLPEYPAIIQELREKGVIINNIEDIERHIKLIKHGMETDIPIQISQYKSYKFHDLENMFPNNLDPTFIDATVQSELAKALKMAKFGQNILFSVVILLVVGAVAVLIIQKAFAGSISSGDCVAMVEAAKCTYGPAVKAALNATII